jgi:hypothetical protein
VLNVEDKLCLENNFDALYSVVTEKYVFSYFCFLLLFGLLEDNVL